MLAPLGVACGLLAAGAAVEGRSRAGGNDAADPEARGSETREESPPRKLRFPSLAIGLGYLAAHLLQRLPWPVAESTDRLAAGVVPLLLVSSWMDGARAGRWGWAIVRRALVCLAVPWWFLGGVLRRQAPAALALQELGLALGLGLVWSGLEALARRRRGPTIPAVLLVTALGGVVALMVSATALYAQLAASLAATLAACTLFAAWRPSFSMAGGGAAAAIVLLGVFGMAGAYLAELPASSAVLLAAAPLAGWIAEIPTARRATTARATWLAVACTGTLVLAACLLAWQDVLPSGG